MNSRKLSWRISPPSRRTRFIFATCYILFLAFSSFTTTASTQSNTWLDSPTSPRKICGAPWGEYNPAGNQKFHNAIDFCGGDRGLPVVAVADGVVVYVDWWQKDYEALNLGHGRTVAVWHPENRIYTYYTHLQEYKVSVGQTVRQGDTVGLEGSSGKSSGPHVHFVTAIMEPQRMVTPINCPQPYCFPNPADFLGKNTVAQDLGLTTISPTGEIFRPSEGASLYSGGKNIDTKYLEFVETAMNTDIPLITDMIMDTSLIEDFSFEVFDEADFIDPEADMITTSAVSHNIENILIMALLMVFVIFFAGFIFSAQFRRGALPVLMVATLVIMLVLYFYPFFLP